MLAIYSYLPNRLDYQLGAFHFKNYFSSRVTTFGEALGGPRLFSDQNFGVLFGLSYPIDRFRRVEMDLTQTFVDRQFFDQDVFGNVAADQQRIRVHHLADLLAGGRQHAVRLLRPGQWRAPHLHPEPRSADLPERAVLRDRRPSTRAATGI